MAGFVSYNRGGQVRLDDGTVWRVGLNYLQVPAGWEPGDEVAVADRDHPTHRFLLTNTASGDVVPAMPSSNLGFHG